MFLCLLGLFVTANSSSDCSSLGAEIFTGLGTHPSLVVSEWEHWVLGLCREKPVLAVLAMKRVLYVFQQQGGKYLNCIDCKIGDENYPFAKAKAWSLALSALESNKHAEWRPPLSFWVSFTYLHPCPASFQATNLCCSKGEPCFWGSGTSQEPHAWLLQPVELL